MASRLTKLRAMSPRELFARSVYEGYTAYERRRHRHRHLAQPDRLRGALTADIAQRADWEHVLVSSLTPGRFFAGVDAPERVRALFAMRYPQELQKARAIASEVARGEIAFFGRRFTPGTDIDWHADPVSGAVWPILYHRDVPVHRGDIGCGDVKYVWEINRHQYFVDLAKVAFLDGSPSHARSLHRLLCDWMTKVPYATGAPWACALEPAFRAWSWLWAYHLVQAVGMTDTGQQTVWLTGFYDHGRFLHRHLERYSSPYNHLVGEASALFALGVLFPCFREAPAWVARGRHVLESTLPFQFHHDGASVEQSTFYHHATLGFYTLSAVLGRRNGIDLSPDVWAAIERGINFSASLVQPNGRLPRIGGADDGKSIRLEHLPLWDFRPYQAIGAVLFARPDFKFVAGRFWEDAIWVLGADAVGEFDHLASRAPRPSAAFPSSGYYIVRSGWCEESDYMCFDCGPQAAGLRRDDVPSAAHGHADCLSVVVSLGGREVLVDPGFFCYNGDPRWEVDFRRTAVHNTIALDGKDQAQHVSKMAWARTFMARPEGWSADDGWARGSHDGYRTAGGVIHRRTAWLRPGGYLVIRDELTGAPGHEARAVFQFAPGRLSVNGSCALYEGRYEMAWVCSNPVQTRTARGGEAPSEGWIVPSLGVREPAPRLELMFSTTQPHSVLLTVLVDRRCGRRTSGEPMITSGLTANGLLCARVSVDGGVDEIVAATDNSSGQTDADSNSPLVIIRRIHDTDRTP